MERPGLPHDGIIRDDQPALVKELQFIFHLGAKVRKDMPEMKIADPSGLMKWLGKDRALVTVGADPAAFQRIVRAWIKHV